MKLKVILGHIVVIAVVVSLAAAPAAMAPQTAAPPPSTIPTASASVVDIRGKVQIELPGKAPSSPTLGQVLPAETAITTGNGKILLRLEDESQILVHSNTHLVLKQPTPT